MNPNMSPVDWAKRPILEKYADFSGRAPRAEYWWYTLAVIVVGIVCGIIESILGLKGMVAGVYGPLTALLGLATLVPGLAVAARRLHDTNRSGWWLLLTVPYLVSAIMMLGAAASGSMAGLGAGGLVAIVGMIGCIVLLVFLVLPGTPGDNRFGPNPYGEGSGGTAAAA